jgi:tetratricopeptide (TPR) repeat protein
MKRAVCAVLAAIALWAPGNAFAAWNEARSPHFIVYSDGPVDQLERFTQQLEKFDGLLRLATGVDRENQSPPLRVFVLRTEDQVGKLAGNSNIAGYYSTTDSFAYAVVSRSAKSWTFDVAPEDVLFHEYAHHFMLHYFPAAYPAWYVEGFAEFYSVIKFPKTGAIQFGLIPMARAPQLVMFPLYPVEELIVREPDDKMSAPDMSRFYATAWLLTHYLQNHETRRAEFKRYLTDLVSGKRDAKLDDYFEGGGKALDKELRAYLHKRLTAQQLAPGAVPDATVTVTPVEAGRAALMVQEVKLAHGVKDKEREAFAQEVGAIAARFPASAYAQALHADALYLADKSTEALAATDRAITLDAGQARALATRAEILLERADESDKGEDWSAALKQISRANRADLENPLPLQLFYRYNKMRGGPMPDLGYDGLNAAFARLPQNPEYRFLYASSLADRRMYAQAIMVLDPIAYSPHESGMREAASKLQEAFRTAQATGDPVAADALDAAEDSAREE